MALWLAGGAAGFLGLTGTRAAVPVYWLWMGIACVTGSVMSRAVLALLYYGLISPLGLVMRLTGRDPLRRRRPQAESYWLDVAAPTSPAPYERQF